jgi:hypothetical protein
LKVRKATNLQTSLQHHLFSFVLCLSVLFIGIKVSLLRQQNKKRGNPTTPWHTCFYITDWFPSSSQHLLFHHPFVTPGIIPPSYDTCSEWHVFLLDRMPRESTVLSLVSLLTALSFNDITHSPEICDCPSPVA